MKLSKIMKRTTAMVLSAAMLAGIMPSSGISTVVAEDSDFDEKNIALRMGIVSDLHISRSSTGESADVIKGKITKYANSVFALDKLAEGKLDALLLCGDYTEAGTKAEGTAFASASKAIMDVINANKSEDEKTKFVMTYGNHDTEKSGNMTYSQWEELLGQYGLMDDMEKGPEGTGSYHATIVKDAKTYHIFSVETETYAENVFRPAVLSWLDEGLAAATAIDPSSYVYVISHAPIQESGVYGSDMNFDTAGNWASAKAGQKRTVNGEECSSDIHAVLEKYPQVMYFSGHTHRTNALESTIMSKDYTAVSVASLIASSDLIDNDKDRNKYIDDDVLTEISNMNNEPKPSYALYLEVDGEGRQRIQRVRNPYNYVSETTVTYTEENQTADKVEVASVTKGTVSVIDNLPDTLWEMKAPDYKNLTHLETYSAENRAKAPTFGEGAAVTATIEDTTVATDGKLTVNNVTFDTATCGNTIIRYEISLVSPSGTVCDSKWVVGNWIPLTNNVAEDSGANNTNATKLTYSDITFKNAMAGEGYKIRVTAVDEFGGTKSINSQDFEVTEAANLVPQTDRYVYDELFQAGTEDVFGFNNTIDEKKYDTESGKGLVVKLKALQGSGSDNRKSVNFFNPSVDESLTTNEKQSSAYQIANKGLEKGFSLATGLPVDATFVWEVSYQLTESESETNGNVTTPKQNLCFCFRLPGLSYSSNDWKGNRSGLYIDGNGAALRINDTNIKTNSDFKLQDTADDESRRVKIISSPNAVSVYIDDHVIFENETFDASIFTASDFTVTNNKMIPAMSFTCNRGVYELFNQSLYYYYPEDEAALHHAVDDNEGSEEFNVTKTRVVTALGTNAGKDTIDVAGSGTDLKTTLTLFNNTNTIRFFNSAKKFGTISGTNANPDKLLGKFTDFDADDTFVWEATFKHTSPETETKPIGIVFNFRMPDGTYDGTNLPKSDISSRIGVHIWDQTVYLTMGDQEKNRVSIGTIKNSSGDEHDIKIISYPNAVTIYLDGKMLCENKSFKPSDLGWPTASGGVMHPTLVVHTRQNGTYEIYNQSVYKLEDDSITPYTSKDQNLVYSENANFRRNLTEVSEVIGNSVYSNILDSNKGNLTGDHKDYSNEIRIFKDGYTPDKRKSYIVSALGTMIEKEDSGVRRLSFKLGKYNGKDIWGYIEGNKLTMITESGTDSNVCDVAKFDEGVTVRVTALFTPFGFKVWLDGESVYEHTFADSTQASFNPTFTISQNVKAAWRDIVVYENVDNGQQYCDEIQSMIDKLENTKGVYYTTKQNTMLSNAESACESFTGKNNATLVPYVGALTYSKAYNNMVLAGKTQAQESTTLKSTSSTQMNIQLFAEGTCPIRVQDKWTVEFDAAIHAKSGGERLGLLLKGTYLVPGTQPEDKDASKGMMMINTGLQSIWKDGASSGDGLSNNSVWISTFPVVGETYHFAFKMTPDGDGKVKITLSVTYLNTSGKQETRSDSATFTLDSVNPIIALTNMDATISNLRVSYDDYDEQINALKNQYTTAKDNKTDGMAIRYIQSYRKACKVASDVTNSTENFYTREELVEAKDFLKGQLFAYGDVNKNEKTDVCDIVHLKKQLKNEQYDEVDILVSDVDGDGDATPDNADAIALRKWLVK